MRATGVQYCGDCVIREVGYIYLVLEMSEGLSYLREWYYGVEERIVCRSMDKE